jgi:hypothetical protein
MRKKRNNNRKKDECSKCGGIIESGRVASNQKYCKECQRLHLNEYRKRKNYLNIGLNQKEKHYARTYANTYLRRGKIEKQPCLICGNSKSEMHHDDYHKPLNIKWFCRKHHMEYHKKVDNVF